jgi:hypothetical protein
MILLAEQTPISPMKSVIFQGRNLTMIRGTLAERFWPRVDKNGPVHPTLGTPCWLWTGGKFKQTGYGVITRGTRAEGIDTTHRVSWELTNGSTDQFVLHHCDVRLCVNPAHLFLGTQTDNHRDMTAKGRNKRDPASLKTHCIRGHEFTPENTGRDKRGWGRFCIECKRTRGERQVA